MPRKIKYESNITLGSVRSVVKSLAPIDESRLSGDWGENILNRKVNQLTRPADIR